MHHGDGCDGADTGGIDEPNVKHGDLDDVAAACFMATGGGGCDGADTGGVDEPNVKNGAVDSLAAAYVVGAGGGGCDGVDTGGGDESYEKTLFMLENRTFDVDAADFVIGLARHGCTGGVDAPNAKSFFMLGNRAVDNVATACVMAMGGGGCDGADTGGVDEPSWNTYTLLKFTPESIVICEPIETIWLGGY